MVSAMLGLVLALLVSSIAASPVGADIAPLRPQFTVNTTTYGHQGLFHGPDVASTGGGEFVVIWEGSYYDGAKAQRFDSLGRRVGTELDLSDPSSDGDSPAVASDGADNFVVVWQNGDGVLGRRFAGSVAQGPPFFLSGTPSDSQTNPKVTVDAAGTFVVVWQQYGFAPEPRSSIIGRRFDSTGNPLGSEFVVVATDDTYLGWNDVDEDPDGIEIAADPGGSFMVAWQEYYGDGYADSIKGRVYDSGGAPLGTSFVVNETTIYAENHPGIAADGTGRFIVVWHSEGRMMVRRYSTSGAALSGEFQANTAPAAVYGPKVAAAPGGAFAVVWEDYDGVHARGFDATGTATGDQFQVDEPDGYSRTVSIAAGAPGTFAVVWADYHHADDDGFGILARRLGPAPTPCAPAAMTGCREPTIPGRGVLRYKANTNPARSTLLWRWVRGEAASVPDFGDPFTTDSYAFCLYDGTGAVFTSVAPAGGACGAIPCWRTLGGSRVDYFDRLRFAGGLEGIRLTPGADGKARAQVKGKGARLVLPTATLTAPVTAQLQGANGECWSASYASGITENTPGRFRGTPGP